MQHYMTAARLLSGLMISTTLLTPALAVTGTVNTGSSNLNVRAEASTSSRIVDKLRSKTQVEVLASVADGAWYQVSHSGTIGYVSADYLLINKDEAAELPSAGSMYVQITASALNVRTGPGTSYSKSGKLHNGDVVKVLAVKNGWYQLENGYISAEYAVKTTAPAKPATPAPAPAEIPDYVQATATVNVRSGAGTEFDKVGKVYGGDVVKVIGMKNGWYQLEKGYISAEYAVKASKPAEKPAQPAKPATPSTPEYVKITAASLNVRSGAGTNYSTVGKLVRNDVVKVKSAKSGWYQIEGGYITDDYAVKTSKPSKVDTVKPIGGSSSNSSKPAEKPAPSTPSNSSKGQQIANYAKQFKGHPYVYGGSSPSGFDCSGFTSYVYAHFGYRLNRTASGQLSNGKSVSKSQLQPGDLVMFRKSGSSKAASHVGLYIGGGKFIHASTPKTGVIISDINSSYYTSTFVGARRIV